MLKWELYRAKCDQIDAAYHEFKKTQQKIRWWNELISEWKCIKKCQYNYDKHKIKTLKECREMLM